MHLSQARISRRRIPLASVHLTGGHLLIGVHLRGRRTLRRTRIVSPADKPSNCVPRYAVCPNGVTCYLIAMFVPSRYLVRDKQFE
jgi:hypothetical protein